MLTLFHAPNSRSTRFLWLLEELGAPYRIEYVSIRRGDGSGGPDPRNPHPHKQVPALDDDGVLVTESAAIALYLTDAVPAAKMGPMVGETLRGPYLTRLAYYAGVLEPAVALKARNSKDQLDIDAYNALDARLKETLDAQPYLLGDAFSAADILYVSLLQFARTLLPPHVCYDDFLARCTARPALARAMTKNQP
ncbi:MAG: glutathione S-transferase family protein [Caulobacterales bacterium]